LLLVARCAKDGYPSRKYHIYGDRFALDGTPRDQFTALVRSGKAPNIARLLGEKEEDNGLFEAWLRDPDALSMFPSSTVADWSGVLTGEPPGRNGVTGDEWFERENTKVFSARCRSRSLIPENLQKL